MPIRPPKQRHRPHPARTGAAIEPLESRSLLAIPKIMPLGDSITEGWSGRDSYRPWLWNMLANAGYVVDFVGNRTGIANGLTPPHPNYDQNHQGTSGWRADQIQANIVSWANQNKPDVVLLHIGTNDINQGQSNTSTETEIRGIIDNLRSVVPNVKILLAQIIPYTVNQSAVADLNNRIANIVTSKTTGQSPITKVDQNTGFNTANLWDGIHPNATGEQFMADRWYPALQAALPVPSAPPAGTYLGDLTPTQQTNGWGAMEVNRSVNDSANNDGRVITLNGVS
jgi:lysophospholipase L1-like esterase